MKQLSILLVGTFAFWLNSCSSGDEAPVTSGCEKSIEIDADDYASAISAPYYTDTIYIEGNCLHFVIGASGCDARSWSARLIDADILLESYPVQRQLRFALENNEACDAFITQTYSFDLSPIQSDNYESIILNIEGLEQSLHYHY